MTGNAEKDLPDQKGNEVDKDPAQIIAKALLCFNDKNVSKHIVKGKLLKNPLRFSHPLNFIKYAFTSPQLLFYYHILPKFLDFFDFFFQVAPL